MGFSVVQTNFNRGEIDPVALSRDDIDQYRAGAKQLTNCLSIPQGGLQRRAATIYKAALAGKARLFAFEFNVDQTYIVAFSNLKAEVFLDGVLIATLTTLYTTANLFDDQHIVHAVQSADTMIVVHEDVTPQKIKRNLAVSGALGLDKMTFVNASQTVTVTQANHGMVTGQTVVFVGAVDAHGVLATDINDVAGHVITRLSSSSFTWQAAAPASSSGTGSGTPTYSAAEFWSISAIVLKNIPKFDFDDSLTPTKTDEVQTIQFTGVWAADDVYRLKNLSTTDKVLYSSSVATQTDRIREALQRLPTNKGTDSIAVVNISGGGTDPKGPYQITWSGDEDGNKSFPDIIPTVVKNAGGGLISVAEIVSGASGEEDVWSSTRGYPSTLTFHERRLVFAASKFRPTSLWASRTNEPFDFAVGDALDDDAIVIDIGAENFDRIEHVLSSRHLQMFTSGNEFFFPQIPLTPRNSAPRRTSSRGSSEVRPIAINGATTFFQRDKRALRQLLFTDTEDSYDDDDLTLLARHLMVSPADMTYQQNTQGDSLVIVNSDGSMPILNINRAQGVFAWTKWVTRSGDFFRSAVALHSKTRLKHELWATLERSVDGSTVYYLERFDDDTRVDSAKTVTGVQQTNWGGFSHLEGEVVSVIGDGMIFADALVTAGIVLTSVPVDSVTVGLNSALPVIELLPPVIELKAGRSTFRKTRISRCTVDVQNSTGVYVSRPGDTPQLVDPPFFGFGARPTFSGKAEARLLGWSEDPTVKIEQVEPFPFLLRGVELEVAVNR